MTTMSPTPSGLRGDARRLRPRGEPPRSRGKRSSRSLMARRAPADRQVLEHLGDQHEEDDDERRERLADRERRDERDRHRQLHRHPPLPERLEGLLEDRVAADERRREGHRVDLQERLPRQEPGYRDRNGDKPDADEIASVDVVLRAAVMLGCAVRRLDTGDGGARTARGTQRSRHRFHDDLHFTYARTMSISSSAARARFGETFSSGSRTW